MTTAFSHMAHGEPGAAFEANPMGIVLFALVALVGAASGYRFVRPRPFDQLMGSVTTQVFTYCLVGAMMVSWLLRILTGQT